MLNNYYDDKYVNYVTKTNTTGRATLLIHSLDTTIRHFGKIKTPPLQICALALNICHLHAFFDSRNNIYKLLDLQIHFAEESLLRSK